MKFFVATVALRKVVQYEVTATDDEAAVKAAKELAQQQHGSSVEVTSVILGLRGESDLSPGTRVVHDIFGPGQVDEIEGQYLGGFRITVKFDRGDVKQLHAPHSSLRLEAM